MSEPLYLFSVDVEDPRLALPDGEALPPRVPRMVDAFLEFLARDGAKGTFFVVGEVARRHPDMIARIAGAGHEIGCHSDAHIPLDRQDKASLRADLERNLDALRSAGAGEVTGYRSPCFSLTERTRWAYDVLAELGFLYSSSVLPASNPLYGWPGFGPGPRIVDGIVELPVSLLPLRRLPLPIGGVYFRALPRPLLRWALGRRRDLGEAVLSYHHPYDIDTEQTYTHAEFRRWSPYDLLMRVNRGAVLSRLEMAKSLGFSIAPYGPYAQQVGQALREQRGAND
ncbi:MAG TPA: polysaccharide deacetylase family protein [Allosphingosinicella sp.]|jgi:polysaccharide deacetylase family protein (PEP-CTERM system associated)